MSSILNERKAKIKEALDKASVAYRAQDYPTALKLLIPYRSDQKVQKVIEKIEAARDKSPVNRKRKPAEDTVSYGVAAGAILAVVGFVVVFGAILYQRNASGGDTTDDAPTGSSTQYAQTYYSIWQGAYVRSCTEADCEIIASIPHGEEVSFIAAADGAEISGSTVWYQVRLSNGREGYIHSTVVSDVYATRAPTRVPRPTPRPTQAPAPESERDWNCRGDNYNCGDFASCSDMRSYMSSCPGDPSNLDGDSDGAACESQCGG